jgi:hypothetical protein
MAAYYVTLMIETRGEGGKWSSASRPFATLHPGSNGKSYP